jgi:hypothetical protein
MNSNLKALPYPVIGRLDDFTESDFQATIDVEKQTTDGRDWIELRYGFLLSNDAVLKLIKERKASYALDISCSETVYRKVAFCETELGSVNFEAGQLYGKVTIDPMVVISQPVSDFSSEDLNSEYSGICFDLRPGDTIAVGETAVKFIEFNKLKFESLVKIETNKDINSETYEIVVQDDFITIYMGENFREIWERFKSDVDKSPLLAMSAYKDCVLAALHYMSHKGADEAGQYRWERALDQKLTINGFKLPDKMDFISLNSLAQRLISNLSTSKLLQNV